MSITIGDLKRVIKDIDDELLVELCWEEWYKTDAGTDLSYDKTETAMDIFLITEKK